MVLENISETLDWNKHRFLYKCSYMRTKQELRQELYLLKKSKIKRNLKNQIPTIAWYYFSIFGEPSSIPSIKLWLVICILQAQ